jgi:hypothetical protein
MKRRYYYLFLLMMSFIYAIETTASAASLDFSLEGADASVDLTGDDFLKPVYTRLDDAKYKSLRSPFLVWEAPISETGLRLMITCGKISGSSDRLENVQLLLVSESDDGSTIKPIQRVKLGDGSSPHIIVPGLRGGIDLSNVSDFMVRIIRRGNNTDAWFYSFDKDDGKLTETLRVNRAFAEKMRVRVKGTLLEGGFAEASSLHPDKTESVDLSEAIGALIEDGLYQLNGQPVPSMKNLSCVRQGWEGEWLHMSEKGLEARVGLSLVAPSKKSVVDVIAVLTKAENGKWAVSDYLFEPFLPYRAW